MCDAQGAGEFVGEHRLNGRLQGGWEFFLQDYPVAEFTDLNGHLTEKVGVKPSTVHVPCALVCERA